MKELSFYLGFSDRSGSGGYHLFYRSDVTDNGILARGPKEKRENYGHVLVWHKQVVAPDSTHPNGNKYTVETIAPIAWISKKQLEEIFGLDLTWKDPVKEILQEATRQAKTIEGDIGKIIPLDKLKKFGEEYRGEHPFHYFEEEPSKTHLNFAYNPSKQTWYCWRHETGGGLLSLIAVKEKVIRCDEAVPGALRGIKFRETLQKARDLGFKINMETPTATENQNTTEEELDLSIILDRLRNQFIFKTPEDIEEPYYYEDGIYKPAEFKIKSLVETWLGPQATTYIVNEILNHVRRGSYVEREEINKFQGIIPVLNGLLDLKTLEIKPYDPNHVFTFKINANYKPDAKCSKFLNCLGETVNKDDMPTLQEYTGYTLLPSMPFHRTLWLIGSGRNGKGTFILTLEAILGLENCAHINITQLNGDRNFSEYQLYGKLINVSSEPTTQRELETPLIKKLSGGDWIDAEVKCKQHRVRFRNAAKFFILGNKYPKVNDNTPAFWERVIIVPFTGVFLEGHGQIQNIERTWLNDPEERSGILNWMIEGLQQLIQNEQFTLSKTQTETITEFKRNSDPIAAWLEDNCVFGPDYYIPRTVSYYNFKEYAEELGADPGSDKKFYARLRQTPKVRDVQTTIKGETEKRFFKGLCLKTEEEKQRQEAEKKRSAQTQLTTLTTETTPSTNSIGTKNNKVFTKEYENTSKSVVTVVRLPPNTPTPCYNNCGREAEYLLTNPDKSERNFCKPCLQIAIKESRENGLEISLGEKEEFPSQ